MKTLLLITLFLSLVSLVGCGDYTPASDAEAAFMITCLEKGLVPKLEVNISHRYVTCKEPE